jgi:hypothetical protein
MLVFSNKTSRGRTAGTTHSLIVTQDGKPAVQLQPNERGKVTLLWNLPKPGTNTSSSATKPGNK